MRKVGDEGMGGAGAAAEKDSFVQRNFACNLHISLANDLTWLQIWQLQVAVAAATPLPTQFSVFNFSCCCNLCIQVAARLMLMMMTKTMMRQLVALVSSILYLFYLQDAFCSCADCQVLPSCSYQEQRTQSASLCLTNYKHNANYYFFPRNVALYQFCAVQKVSLRDDKVKKYIHTYVLNSTHFMSD